MDPIHSLAIIIQYQMQQLQLKKGYEKQNIHLLVAFAVCKFFILVLIKMVALLWSSIPLSVQCSIASMATVTCSFSYPWMELLRIDREIIDIISIIRHHSHRHVIIKNVLNRDRGRNKSDLHILRN